MFFFYKALKGGNVSRIQYIADMALVPESQREAAVKEVAAVIRRRVRKHGLELITDFGHRLVLFYRNPLPIEVKRYDSKFKLSLWRYGNEELPSIYTNAVSIFHENSNRPQSRWELNYPNEYIIECYRDKIVVHCMAGYHEAPIKR
jgi:hypothetical protein